MKMFTTITAVAGTILLAFAIWNCVAPAKIGPAVAGPITSMEIRMTTPMSLEQAHAIIRLTQEIMDLNEYLSDVDSGNLERPWVRISKDGKYFEAHFKQHYAWNLGSQLDASDIRTKAHALVAAEIERLHGDLSALGYQP